MFGILGRRKDLKLFDAVASSHHMPLTEQDNIARGRAAMRVVLRTQDDFHHAMYRADLGWIDFVWGEVGVMRLNGKTKGGKGIAHILEARMRKDGYSSVWAHSLVYRMVTTIAKGKIVKNLSVNQSRQIILDYQRHQAVLIKDSINPNEWLLTGWKNNAE